MKKILYLFFFINLCYGQVNNEAFPVQWINTDDGLNQLTVYEAVADNNGFVWIATNLGLYKYNWKEATLVTDTKYPSIDKQIISYLYKDPATGVIYFHCSPEKKNYCIENNEIKLLTASEGLYIPNGIYVKSNNPLFSAISHYVNSNIAFDQANFFFNNNAIITKNFYYTLSKNKLVILNKKGTAKVIDFPNAEKTMIFKSQGYVFVANKAKIVMLRGTTINNDHIKADKIVADFIASEAYLTKRNAFFFFEGQSYINFKNSIYKIDYKNDKLTASFVFNCPVNEYSKFSYSKMHELWVGGSFFSGALIVRKNNFNTIPTQKNRNGYSDYVVVKKNDNWYNLTGWIYTKSTKKIHNRWLNNMSVNMRFLLEYKSDFFFESYDRRLTSLTNLKNKLPFRTDDNLNSMDYVTGYTYLNDTLWLSNDKTVFNVTKDKLIVDSLITKQFKKNQVINALNTVDGHLIVASTNGVFLYKPFSGKIRYIKGLENVNARYIKHIDKTNYWVGCYGEGLYLVHNNKAHRVIDKNIDISTAHAIEEDDEGNLWISTNNGLLTINKEKAISNTLKKIPIESYLFSTSEGLPTNEFNGGGTFPSLQDTDGTIGFPSMKGFVWFHPENVKKQSFKGSIIIDEVLSDNTVIRPVVNNIYKIPNDAALLTIKFNYGYSGNKKNLTVSYKFEDQETWTIVEQNTIQIPRYEKGSHKLQIKINTHGFDDEYDVVKSVTLDFEPRFYETAAFWILASFLTILLILFSYLLGNYYRRICEKNLEQIINQNTTALRISNETIKKTFAIVSHDLKGPFNSILGFSSYILKNYDEITPDELKKYVKAIDSSANKNYQLTLQLLSWSLKQQNGITINKQCYNLNDVIDKAISVLMPLANQKSIEINTHSELGTRATGYFDIDIIFNIMYNIISNAIKYSPQNSIITIKSYVDATAIYIETQDAGLGMDSQLLAKLNSKKTPEDFIFVTDENEYLGGFGLTYAKELAALYNGSLAFKSEVNQGTTVIFSFPIDEDENHH